MKKTTESITWASVAILLILAVIAPFFGDNPVAVVMPLLLAVVVGGGNLTLRRKTGTRSS